MFLSGPLAYKIVSGAMASWGDMFQAAAESAEPIEEFEEQYGSAPPVPRYQRKGQGKGRKGGDLPTQAQALKSLLPAFDSVHTHDLHVDTDLCTHNMHVIHIKDGCAYAYYRYTSNMYVVYVHTYRPTQYRYMYIYSIYIYIYM